MGWFRRACRPMAQSALLCVALALSLGAGCTPAVRAGSTAAPDPPPRLVVSLTFNDGLNGQYQYARPLLAAHRMRATFFLASGWIDARWPCCMTWWQVDELYRAGHEIGGMGRDHADLTEPTGPGGWPAVRGRLQREVCADRARLAERGYDPVSFAYPGGAYAAAFRDGTTPQDLVRRCGYRSARAVGGVSARVGRYANPLPPPDPFAVRTPDATAGPLRLADLTRQVTEAAQHRGWLPLAFDHVCHRGAADYSRCLRSSRPVDDTVLAGFLDWLGAAGRPGGAPARTVVRPMREALGAPPQPPLPVRRTVVSLTFDDANRTHYLMRSALLDHGMRATFYVNSELVDKADGSTMSWEQLRELARDGNDVGGHTLTDADLLRVPPAEQRRQVCGDRARLVAHGFSPVSFAYPNGGFDPTAERTVRDCGYLSARTAGGVSPAGPYYAAQLPPPDRYATTALDGREGPIQLPYLIAAVRGAAEHGGGWVQLIFHRLCRPSDRDYTNCMRSHRPVEVSVLGDFLQWVEADAPPGTEVRTVRDVMEGR